MISKEQKFIELNPPHGVAIVQWSTGARIIFQPEKLNEVLLMLKGSLAAGERLALDDEAPSPINRIKCTVCNGKGQVLKRGSVFVCTACNGAGKVIAEEGEEEIEGLVEIEDVPITKNSVDLDEVRQNPIPQLLPNLQEGGHIAPNTPTNTSIINGRPAEINTGITEENETTESFSDS